MRDVAGKGQEEQTMQAARLTATATIELLNLVQQHMDEIPKMSSKEYFLLEVSKNFRNLVLQFIEAAKSQMSNPLDFFSRQKLDNMR